MLGALYTLSCLGYTQTSPINDDSHFMDEKPMPRGKDAGLRPQSSRMVGIKFKLKSLLDSKVAFYPKTRGRLCPKAPETHLSPFPQSPDRADPGLHLPHLPAPRGNLPITSLLMVESRCIIRCRWPSRLAPDEHLARAAAWDSRSLCRTIASQPSHSAMVCA